MWLRRREPRLSGGGERAGRAGERRQSRPRRPDRRSRRATDRGPLPWYLLVLGVAVAASTSAAQQNAVARLSAEPFENSDPLPQVAPDWIKESRRARHAWTLVNRVVTRMGNDNLTLVAAGVAFYAMFSIFPALGALVSIYGLFGDTHVVQAQVQQLTVLLPSETAKLLNDTLNKLLSKPNASLNTGLLISLGVAIWAARAGTSSLMSGLNMALERPERRSLVGQYAMSIALTFGALVFSAVALTAVAVIPIVLDVLPLDPQVQTWLAYSRWPILFAFVILALDVVYRFGPSVEHPRWRFMSVGTLFAAALWVVGSFAFSLYVTRFGSYDTTYGSLGAVIVLLLWFWISALIILLGATVDAVRAELKRH